MFHLVVWYNSVKRWLEEVKVKSVFHLVVWYNSVKRWLEEVKVKSVFHLVVVCEKMVRRG